MIGRLRRAYCWAFGHLWARWSDWESDGSFGFVHTRSCTRCPAIEIQYDGEEGYVRG